MRTSSLFSSSALCALLCIAACDSERTINPYDGGLPPRDTRAPEPDRNLTPPPPRPDIGPPPITPGQPIDILFVIDNSGSMGSEQQALVQTIDGLFEGLRSASSGKLPSLRVGVVSTDLGAGNYSLPSCEVTGGDGAKLLNRPGVAGCVAPTDPWIALDEGLQINVPGAKPTAAAAADAFRCIGAIGIQGCGFEMPLAAARRAVNPKLNINPGFLRQGAALLIVFVGDEDDCSARNAQLFDPQQQGLTDPLGPLTSFRCFEFGIQCDINDRNKPGPRKNCVPTFDWLYRVGDYIKFFASLGRPVAMAGLLGPRQPVVVGKDGQNPWLKPSCQGANGVAAPAIRIRSVMDAFPNVSGPICEPTKFKDTLRAAAKLLNP
jgi:hypothetical protein